ncbi:MAG: permease prefix domain 1-containing protein [Defluviitaleaceae bacterium]|nr:permease prefix domain 1-containing protein [Defluviitaleaceae bacterium]
MEAIKTYLDNVFSAYPQTSEVQNLRHDMLANMEEKFNALRQGGKSEHEAAYTVIADFGSIEEITTELGLNKSPEAEKAIHLSWEEAQTYISTLKKTGIWIGFGVWLIIAGISAVVFIDNVFVMFLAIATAVIIFIISGIKRSDYGHLEETPIQLNHDAREKIESGRANFMPRYTAMTCCGVVLILLSVGAFGVIEYPVEIFLNIIGIAVFLFITSSSSLSAYDVLLGKGNYRNKKSNTQVGRIISTIAVVYWPVATAIGLWQLFAGNAYFWVVWPVAGVLFGGIVGGVAVWFGSKKE